MTIKLSAVTNAILLPGLRNRLKKGMPVMEISFPEIDTAEEQIIVSKPTRLTAIPDNLEIMFKGFPMGSIAMKIKAAAHIRKQIAVKCGIIGLQFIPTVVRNGISKIHPMISAKHIMQTTEISIHIQILKAR